MTYAQQIHYFLSMRPHPTTHTDCHVSTLFRSRDNDQQRSARPRLRSRCYGFGSRRTTLRNLSRDLANRNRNTGTGSEEHTSEVQSHVNLVCRLLLEKNKNNQQILSNIAITDIN